LVGWFFTRITNFLFANTCFVVFVYLFSNLVDLALNGIEIIDNKFLIVSRSTTPARFFKVTLGATPVVTEITINNNSLKRIDGLYKSSNGKLYCVGNLDNSIMHVLSSSDNWVTANIEKSSTLGWPNAASVVERNGYPYFDVGYLGGSSPRREFYIVRANVTASAVNAAPSTSPALGLFAQLVLVALVAFVNMW